MRLIKLNLKNEIKKLSFWHKLRFSNSYNVGTRFHRLLIFRTINSGRSNSPSLKYQRITPSGCKDIGVRKCNLLQKTQFLWLKYIEKVPEGRCEEGQQNSGIIRDQFFNFSIFQFFNFSITSHPGKFHNLSSLSLYFLFAYSYEFSWQKAYWW